MRHIISILALVVLASSASAQGYITVSKTSHKGSTAGAPPTRDFWFAIPQNSHPNDANEVFTVYVISRINTTVNIQVQGQPVIKRSATANQTVSYKFQRNLEINRSSAIETDKAIHIWSDDADIVVYFLSRNDYTSDGSAILPSCAYGKEYVVASYSALNLGSSVDMPSEFIVIATKDNTDITITPSKDIRKEGLPTQVLYPKNIPFSITLQKGECIQYQTTLPLDDGWDLSGTRISSTQPIAVIGASACPFIPSSPYCDFVMEMIPPVDTWGKTYYSGQFGGRQWGGDSFMIISSKSGQAIYRNGQIYCTLQKYETYLRDDITGANAWTSDAPFLLVQYINSATYGVPSGQPRNTGDPAMVVLFPADAVQNNVTFITPDVLPSSGQTSFTHYVNILLRTSSVGNTMMDGKPITSYSPINRTPISGSNWEAFRIDKVGVGRHSLTSDSGVSVYAYGYYADDSYAWSAPGTLLPINSLDTVPPTASSTQGCYCTNITIQDKHINSSKLLIATASIDSNMIVLIPDDVSGADSIVVKVCVADSTKPAAASIEAFDDVGNTIVIKSSYVEPQYLRSVTPKVSFGNVPVTTSSQKLAEIQNMGSRPDSILSMSLVSGSQGFAIANNNATTYAPGETKAIAINFSSDTEGSFHDTLLYTTSCQTNRIPLMAGTEMPEGKTPDSIYVGCIPVGDTLEGNVIFTNANTYPLTIIAINQSGDPDFVRDGTPSLPLTVAQSATAKIGIRFNPLSATQKNALLTVVYQTDDAIRDSVSTKLAGCGLDLGVEDEPEIHTLPSNSPEYTHAIERLRSTDELMFIQSLIPNPASGIVKCVYAIDEATDVSIELLDILGKVVQKVKSQTFHPKGVYETTIDVSTLSSGTYFWRMQSKVGVVTTILKVQR